MSVDVSDAAVTAAASPVTVRPAASSHLPAAPNPPPRRVPSDPIQQDAPGVETADKPEQSADIDQQSADVKAERIREVGDGSPDPEEQEQEGAADDSTLAEGEGNDEQLAGDVEVGGRVETAANTSTVSPVASWNKPLRKKTCILKLDGCHYTIVANAVDTNANFKPSRDNGSRTAKPKILPRTGSLTVLKRTSSAGTPQGSGPGVPGGGGGGEADHDVTTADCNQHGNEDDNSATGNVDIPPADSTAALKFCSIRLKQILDKLVNNEVCCKDELVSTLKYAAKVSENIYIVEISRVTDEQLEDDMLGVVEQDGVPREVRDWLTMTFTRTASSAVSKPVGDGDKPLKFRSVAHAIRAGIVVDRIYRRLSSTASHDAPPAIQPILKNVCDWSFDVFTLNDVSDGHALKYVGHELLHRYDITTKFKVNILLLENFFAKLELGYSRYNNPYHNLLHAADVAQTANVICSQTGLIPWMTDLEIFAVVTATLIHDYEHTGTTNAFHVNTNSDIALCYNDRAVLENYHVSASFRLLREEEFNILSGLKPDEYREFRSLVIELVLATDMSNHFQQIKTMKNLLALPDNIDKTAVLSLIVHCADISHPAKDWKQHHRWTDALLEEFFRQGDIEAKLGLPISPLCDRKNTLVAESQIGFIDFIVDPSFHVMTDAIEELTSCLQKQCRVPTSSTPAASDSCGDVTDSALTSPLSDAAVEPSPPPTPKSPLRGKRHKLTECWEQWEQCWEQCLVDNKSRWRERAATDAVKRAQAEAAAAAAAESRDENTTDDESRTSEMDTQTTTTTTTTTLTTETVSV